MKVGIDVTGTMMTHEFFDTGGHVGNTTEVMALDATKAPTAGVAFLTTRNEQGGMVVTAYRPGEARKLAASLLRAADWTEGLE